MFTLKERLKKLKVGKAPGPDQLEPELYKYFLTSPRILDFFLKFLNSIIQESNVPSNWKLSNTIMIPKTSKPKVDQLRPIALTNVSYKILMGSIKDLIEQFIIKTEQLNPFQWRLVQVN